MKMTSCQSPEGTSITSSACDLLPLHRRRGNGMGECMCGLTRAPGGGEDARRPNLKQKVQLAFEGRLFR